MKSVIIRADSSSTIGTGHVMRDLVLAKQFEDKEIIFATRNLPGNINHKIEEAGYRIATLSSNRIEELATVAKRYHADTIVIDHYDITADDEKKLKERTAATIFVLDDTYEEHYCDILLNHNVYADPNRYKGLVPNHCELRCGPKFTLLRDEFVKAKKKKVHLSSSIACKKRLQAFIAIGGADHSNKNIDILKVLQRFDNIQAHVVTTTANRNLDALKNYVKGKNGVSLHINSDNIAELMASSDFAIVTPSVTINEVIFMELPFIAIQTADNQKEMSAYLEAARHPMLETFDSTQLQREVERIAKNRHTEIINFVELSDKDKEEVLTWRNHQEIRKWMLNKDPISRESHFAYIDSLSHREDRLYFLVKHRGKSIGVVDFTQIDRRKKEACFGLYAVPMAKGYGKLLMQTVVDYGFGRLNLKKLVAEVYRENEKAVRLYKKFGFQEVENFKKENNSLLRMELYR